MARSIEQIYAYAPEAARNRLRAFRERYPAKIMDRPSGMYRCWDINDAHSANLPVVFLPTGLGHGEMWFPYLLEGRYFTRCIAFSLADANDVTTLAEEYLDMLTVLGVSRFVLVAQSVGGLVAQVMAARAPERVAGLCLITSGAPAKDLPAPIRARWVARKQKRLKMSLQGFGPNMRLALAGRMYAALCPERYEEAQTFWPAYFEETFLEYMYKKMHLNFNTGVLPSVYEKYAFTKESFAPMPVLLMTSSGDKTFTPEEQTALQTLFPQAQVYDMGDVGQLSLQLEEEKNLPVLLAFLEKTCAV